MAWETRGGRRYYYRKVKRDGRVFSVYEGGGLSGTLAAERDAEARGGKAQTRAALRGEAARQDAIDAKIDAAWLVAQDAANALLEAAGYHRHKRQWRVKRGEAKTEAG